MPTLTQIQAEIDADPATLGYATLRALANAPEAITNKMNEVGASNETIFKSYVNTEDAAALVVATEYNALTAANKAIWNDLVRAGSRIKSGEANMRTTLGGVFAAGTTSRTNLVNLASRSASRAEALWGEGTVIQVWQVAEIINP